VQIVEVNDETNDERKNLVAKTIVVNAAAELPISFANKKRLGSKNLPGVFYESIR
jgi:hypothetical protein